MFDMASNTFSLLFTLPPSAASEEEPDGAGVHSCSSIETSEASEQQAALGTETQTGYPARVSRHRRTYLPMSGKYALSPSVSSSSLTPTLTQYTVRGSPPPEQTHFTASHGEKVW